MSNSEPIRFAQFSDPHLLASSSSRYWDVDTQASLRHVLNRLKALESALDFLLFTGDATQDHSAESYKRLQSLVSAVGIKLPIYWTPGNHDDLNMLSQALSEPFCATKIIDKDELSLMLVNTKSSTPAGELTPAQIEQIKDWADARQGQFKVLVGHHHMLAHGSFIDKHILHNGAQILEVLKQCDIKVYLHGHVHSDTEVNNGDIRLIACPSTAAQFSHDSDECQIKSRLPGFRRFEFDLASGLITSTEYCLHE